jgi:hypothetical protein
LLLPPPGAVIIVVVSDVTRILSAISRGDPHAAGQLLPLVYEELRRLALRGDHLGPGGAPRRFPVKHE